MNLSLLDPFAVASDFPETLTETLSYGYSSVIAFNRKGDYLASGLATGTVVVIDIETNNAVQILSDHVRAITALCWSQDGRYLLSASRDWKVNLWDLKTAKVVRSVTFDSAIWNCVMVPGRMHEFVAALVDDDPVYVKDGEVTRLETPYTPESKPKKHLTLCTAVSPDGKYILTGTNRGYVNVIEIDGCKLIKSFKVCDSNIKDIEFSPGGEKMIVNASDKTLRQYNIEGYEFTATQKYTDVVNKIQYNSVKFSHDSEYMCASTLGSSHDIYIWETKMGSLVKILEGSKEELICVDWNHRRCSIAATGMDSGTIYLWSVVMPQKWSNLAPDFEEIEENIDYEEKEDEFDLVDRDKENDERVVEEEDVDVVTREEKDARGFPFVESFVIETVLP